MKIPFIERRFHRLMHAAHRYQVLLAFVVAAIFLTTAWFMPRPPLVEPRLRDAAGAAQEGAAVAWGASGGLPVESGQA